MQVKLMLILAEDKCYQAVGFELLNTIYTYSVKKIA